MIAALTSGEILTIIAAIVAGISSILGAIFAGLASLRIKAHAIVTDSTRLIAADTNREVKTMNGQTIAELADASESRRIDEIRPAERTSAEDEHIATVPEPPAGG